jgi:hypothetical protein
MAEPQYPPPSSGVPEDPYAPTQQAYPPTRQLPADEYAQPANPQQEYYQPGYAQPVYPQQEYPQQEYYQPGYPAPASALPASAQPASGQPASMVPYSGGAAPYAAAPEQVIAQIGEIQVTSTTVRTPTCGFPLRGSQWQVVDAWTATQRTAGWAIALAILLFFCIGPFSLLFLLAKTSSLQGQVQVQVSNGPLSYVSRIVVNNQQYVQHVYAQVNYVRALSAM